jgi:hypothetical protein
MGHISENFLRQICFRDSAIVATLASVSACEQRSFGLKRPDLRKAGRLIFQKKWIFPNFVIGPRLGLRAIPGPGNTAISPRRCSCSPPSSALWLPSIARVDSGLQRSSMPVIVNDRKRQARKERPTRQGLIRSSTLVETSRFIATSVHSCYSTVMNPILIPQAFFCGRFPYVVMAKVVYAYTVLS